MKSNRHQQLRFAREYRGYSQTELASRIAGLSQSNLSKYEKGFDTMSEEVLEKTMNFLKFPLSFLSKNIWNESNTAHFRKRSTITKKIKRDIEHSYRIIGNIVDEMEDSIMWPEFKFKTFDLELGISPELAAYHTRKLFGLKPNEPVREIYNLLEVNGIVIVEFDAMMKFDGVSFVTDKGIPVIVLNQNFSNDRKRFTIAHELGHLLMHSVNDPILTEDRKGKIEQEANRFASEFLMPEVGIANSLRDLKLRYLAELKKYWLTSKASLIRRAKDLGCITQKEYTYLNVEFSRGGERKQEKENVFIDSPELFKKGYFMHKNELGYSSIELAEAFALPIDVIKRFCNFPRVQTKLRVII